MSDDSFNDRPGEDLRRFDGMLVKGNNAVSAGGHRINMRDVAHLSGVSVGTVSNTLNRPDIVSESTRQRVWSAIERLGWVPNETARQLRSGRGRTIGMVVMDVSNPFFTDVMTGVEEAAVDSGFFLQFANSNENPDRETLQLELFGKQQVRGVLLAPVQQISERVGQLRRAGIPVVIVDRAGDGADYCTASTNDVTGGRLAAAHLIEQGHRRLAFVGGPDTLHQVRDRSGGAAAEVKRMRHTGTSMIVVPTERPDLASGTAAAQTLLDMQDRPTGVFATNDLVAIGLLQGFVTQGVRVPEDVAIIGYDDIKFAAAAAVPLSSIRQQRQQLGEAAMQLLLGEIEDLEAGVDHVHEHRVFEPTLVVRQSTGVPQGVSPRR